MTYESIGILLVLTRPSPGPSAHKTDPIIHGHVGCRCYCAAIAYCLLPVACISQSYKPPRLVIGWCGFPETFLNLLRPDTSSLSPTSLLFFSSSPLFTTCSILVRIPPGCRLITASLLTSSDDEETSSPIPSCRRHLALPFVDPPALAGLRSIPSGQQAARI